MSERRRRRGPQLRAIEIQHASVRLGRHWALREVSFVLRAGERWLVTGPNGAGKTVLLKLLRGDLWPTPTGRERRLYRLGRECIGQPREARPRIAYLGPERQDKYQRYDWDLAVRDVVGTGLFDTDIPLDRVDARGRRAIVARRRLLLLDEPFDGLDAATSSTALRVIGDLAARRVQVVLATHHGDDVPGYVRNVLAFGRAGIAKTSGKGGA